MQRETDHNKHQAWKGCRYLLSLLLLTFLLAGCQQLAPKPDAPPDENLENLLRSYAIRLESLEQRYYSIPGGEIGLSVSMVATEAALPPGPLPGQWAWVADTDQYYTVEAGGGGGEAGWTLAPGPPPGA